MKTEIKRWEEIIFPNLNDNLVIECELPILTASTDEYNTSLKIYWKHLPSDIYIPKNLSIYSTSLIEYTFENNISIRGEISLKEYNSFDTEDTLGVFANLYYYTPNTSNYIWHTEGFLISFSPNLNTTIQ